MDKSVYLSYKKYTERESLPGAMRKGFLLEGSQLSNADVSTYTTVS